MPSDAGETRMIGLPYGEKIMTNCRYVKPFSSNPGTSRTDGHNCYINIARQCADAQQKCTSSSADAERLRALCVVEYFAKSLKVIQDHSK